MEAVREWDPMDGLEEMAAPAPPQPASRKRRRDDDSSTSEDGTEKVARSRFNDWQPALQTNKRRREEEEAPQKVSRARVNDWQPALQTNKRRREEGEAPFERSTRLRIQEEITIIERTPYERRLDVILCHIQGAMDALHAGLIDDHRIYRLEQIVEDVLWLHGEKLVPYERFSQITTLLACLCDRHSGIMQRIRERVGFLFKQLEK